MQPRNFRARRCFSTISRSMVEHGVDPLDGLQAIREIGAAIFPRLALVAMASTKNFCDRLRRGCAT